MQPTPGPDGVVAVTNLAEFFLEALHGVLADQRLAVEEPTQRYVADMLTAFARAERLYESTGDGQRPTLAQLLVRAFEAVTIAERNLALQRLGDVSLFMAGILAHGFSRSLVDIDYHIAMGGRAYGTLAHSLERGRRRALARVFAELASKFQPLTDALAEIGEAAYVYTQRDVLRLYEVWLKTGSARARRLLWRLGIEAIPVTMRPA